MKRCWFGLGLLLVLLALSLATAWGMDKIHSPIAGMLRQAASCAQEEDWDEAESLSRQAEADWKKWELFRACFADHTPTEDIAAELAAMTQARQQRETAEFAASCARVSKMVQAVGDAHGLYWWNFF